jgi:hypothetical protein
VVNPDVVVYIFSVCFGIALVFFVFYFRDRVRNFSSLADSAYENTKNGRQGTSYRPAWRSFGFSGRYSLRHNVVLLIKPIKRISIHNRTLPWDAVSLTYSAIWELCLDHLHLSCQFAPGGED